MICTEDKGSDYQPSPGQCHLPGELHAGRCDESLSVQNAITTLELRMRLVRARQIRVVSIVIDDEGNSGAIS